MIPKIAHFHWEGEPLNWLRMMSIYTFARLNPRWEIRLIRTPDHIRKRNLPEYAHGADWAWYEALYEHGGFAMATDTVFVKPIPDEWCDAEMCGCTNGSKNLWHCCIGSVPSTRFLSSCIDRCEKMSPDDIGYEDMGILLMKDVMASTGMPKKFFDYPLEAMCPVHCWDVSRCWERGQIEITDEVIGVTWFGGDDCSGEKEWETPGKHKDSAIVKLALEVTGDS